MISIEIRLDIAEYSVSLYATSAAAWKSQRQAYMCDQDFRCSVSGAHIGEEKTDIVISRAQKVGAEYCSKRFCSHLIAFLVVGDPVENQ